MEKELKRVGTHNGKFHADEVMATVFLKELYNVDVVRSRDPEVLKGLDIVYDVGEGEFDHHQMDKKLRENGTPYASCGLIWNHFGRDVIRNYDRTSSEEDVEYIFNRIDAALVEGIDASDNGVKTCRTFIPTLNLSAIISKFNPPWDSQTDEDSAFHEAVGLACVVFHNILRQKFSVAKARDNVTEAYNNRPDPGILQLDRSYPWNEVINEIDTNGELIYVVYPDHDQYLVQMARKHTGKHGIAKPLPLSWAGKRDAELSLVTGVADAVFCHSDRFIAGARSLESALKMACLALAEPEEPEEAKKRRFVDALRRFLLSSRIRIKT